MSDEPRPPAGGRGRRRRLAGRLLLLGVTAVSLYLLLPSLLEVFSSWQRLRELEPLWVGLILVFAAASFLAVWDLLRVALRTGSWFTVGTSQLAGTAFSRIVPGGMAASGALQYQMLTRGGVEPALAGSGLAVVSAIQFATLVAFPVLALPAILGGTPVAEGLTQAAYLGAGAFVLMAAAGGAALFSDAPLRLVARIVTWALARARPRRPPPERLAERLLAERNAVRTRLGRRWARALVAAVGSRAFDYLALIAALEAVGATADPSLVLLAYVAASLLGMVPLTPGGLGFVEAGLVGTLALAGVGGGNALVATLAYRLGTFWLPIPAGLLAWWLFRRRYPLRRSPADSPDPGAESPSPRA